MCITDRDQVIAVSGTAKKDFLGKEISKNLEALIEERSNVAASRGDKKYTRITNEEDDFMSQAVCPIICEGDAIGSVIITTRDEKVRFGDLEQKLATSAAGFLGKQMEL